MARPNPSTYLMPSVNAVANSGSGSGSGGGFNAQGIADLGGALGTLGGGVAGLVRSFRDDDDDDGGFMGLGNPFDPKYADEARAKVDTEYGKLLEQTARSVS